jgi:putative ABC transport system permease protein
MTASLRGELEEWGERAVLDKLWIEGLAGAPIDELAAEQHRLPEVVGVEPGDARAHVDFLLIGLRADELAGYGPAAEDPAVLRALAEGEGAVVSTRLARQRELAVGDRLLVDTSGHGVQSFPVVAVSDAYGYFIHPDERAYAVTSDRHLHRFFCVDTASVDHVAVRLAEGAGPMAVGSAGAVEALVRARYPDAPDLRFTSGRRVLAHHLEDLGRDFVLFDLILGLTALLAGLGVLNGLLLSALERRKELGVLRALGTSDRQLAGAVLLESALLGAVGGALGLAVGAALTPVLVLALRALSGLDLPLRTAGPWLAALPLGAVALAVLAGLYPLWRMRCMDAVRAVRTG